MIANIIDLFCGAGGISSGFKKAGFNILLGIDNNKDAIDTFKLNQNTNAICEDIKQLNISNEDGKIIIQSSKDINIIHEINQKIHVVVGGVPCRAASSLSNGKNKSKSKEEYADLYKEYIRFVKIIKPEVFIIENVKEFLNATDNDGKVIFTEICNELGVEPFGYNIKYNIVNMADYKIPQCRERLIIIGSKIENIELPSKLVTSDENYITVGQAILDLPEETITYNQKTYDLESNKIKYEDLSEYQCMMRNNKEYIYNHITPNHKEKTKLKISCVPAGGNWMDLPYKLLSDDDEFKENKKTQSNSYKRLDKDKPSHTITNIHKTYTIHPLYNRLLSVREGARLQGFEDAYIFKGGISSQYQQVADAVPPIFSKLVAEKIYNVLIEADM